MSEINLNQSSPTTDKSPMHKISIIVPAYNVAPYIERCINSIQSQSYPNIEIVVIDDGSEDDTGNIINMLSAADSRIKTISQQNSGQARARKRGLEVATTEYICFVDADDWIESDYCEQLYSALIATGADIATCGCFIESENGEIEKTQTGSMAVNLITAEEALEHLHRRTSVFQYPVNKLFKKSVLENVVFPEHPMIGEDYDMVIQALEDASFVVSIENPLYHYVQRNGSMSKAGFDETILRSVRNYERIQQTLNEKHPQLKDAIACYHVLDKDIGMLTPMARNDVYDNDLIKKAQADVRKNLKLYLRQSNDGAAAKLSACLLSISPKLFFAAYKIFSNKTK